MKKETAIEPVIDVDYKETVDIAQLSTLISELTDKVNKLEIDMINVKQSLNSLSGHLPYFKPKL